jgi:hypothetical protein
MGIGTHSGQRIGKRLLRGGIAVAASGTIAATVLAGVANAATGGGYQYVTLGSHHDRTFNQLLGINNEGKIAAYFGSGNAGHPNKGFTMVAPYQQNDISGENFPGSRQTQVTGLNDHGVTVGFFSTMNGATPADDNNFGFVDMGGRFTRVDFPTTDNANPPVNQLLGVNNRNVAVGFYVNGQGQTRGYEYDIAHKSFTRVTVPGAPTGGKAPNLTAAAINDNGDVAGFYNVNANLVDGFLKLKNGTFIKIQVPGAAATQAFGVNNHDTVVGTYTMADGATHGFVFRIGGSLVTNVDDPNGIGTTLLNGINNEGDIVGFYTDAAGNTDGLLGFPAF